ncbi:MAG TPA: trypsin-like peptidase domain-containing protein [Candidatus Limnocylindrales bacterium]|nr:trypsin-like peptidase domain-containing protein [Candidatus Limnocylindrales bacterium]
MTTLELVNGALSDVVTVAQQAVVAVRDGQRGSGAGTIWQSDGLIVTNAHVVRGGAIEVQCFDGRVFPARLIARDTQLDLAALAVDAHDLPTIQPANGRDLQPGQWLLALGHPWGVAYAATAGVLISRSPHAPDMPALRNDWVVTDLHLRPGNSGGPVIDSRGRMVGVSTLMNGVSVGVAISVETVKAFLKEALGGGRAALI